MDLESAKKLSSLAYIIKCLKHYRNGVKAFIQFNEMYSENVNTLTERIFKITADLLKSADYSKYDLDNKSDKIKFLLFFQIYLTILFHTFNKFTVFSNILKTEGVEEPVKKIFVLFEKIIYSPLTVYHKLAAPRINKDNNEDNISEMSEQLQGESVIRMKINEVITINVENLPMLYKIYNKFYETVDKLLNYKCKLLKDQLIAYNNHLFIYYLYHFYNTK